MRVHLLRVTHSRFETCKQEISAQIKQSPQRIDHAAQNDSSYCVVYFLWPSTLWSIIWKCADICRSSEVENFLNCGILEFIITHLIVSYCILLNGDIHNILMPISLNGWSYTQSLKSSVDFFFPQQAWGMSCLPVYTISLLEINYPPKHTAAECQVLCFLS